MAFQTSVEQAMYGPSFEKMFDAYEHQADMVKIRRAAKRALEIQARNKIKGVDRRPDLLLRSSRSQLRGGDVLREDDSEELFYYPQTVSFSASGTTGTMVEPASVQSRLDSAPVPEEAPIPTGVMQEPMEEVVIEMETPAKKKKGKRKGKMPK